MIEVVLISIMATILLFVLAAYFVSQVRLLKIYERREEQFFALIKQLQNKVAAKDISAYLALESEDRKSSAPEATKFLAGNDQNEAAIEAARLGLEHSELERMMGSE
jgi:DNA-binding transcriptional MerR regulator